MPVSTEAPSSRRLALELLLASFVVLFQELALIRWLPGQVRVLAYFPNLILLSAFLGLGLGALSARRRSLLPFWIPMLLVILGAAWGLSRVVFTQESATEHLFLLYYDLPGDAPVVGDIKLPLLFFFVLGALGFLPLGQAVAARLQALRGRTGPLYGYLWDLGGSLLGVLGFAVVGFSGLFPWTWFLLGLLVGAPLVLRPSGRAAALALAGGGLVVMVVSRAERADYYSPYYAIRYLAAQPGFSVLTNGSLHQTAFPLRRADPVLSDVHATIREGYHLPYRFLPRPPRRALVIGAGTGNDVSVLLDEGAEQIDAVEIDPVILNLGRSHHPDKPYRSPRVRAITTDARSFLNASQERYDLIVFGTLDSMTSLSALSNVRLDNFVYTLECFQAARRRLAPDGGLILYFMASSSFISERLGGMLTEAFGEAPLAIIKYYHLFNRAYLIGPAFSGHGGPERQAQAAEVLRAIRARVELPTDDWPYLYVARRGLSGFYVALTGALAALAVAAVFAVSPAMRRSLGGTGAPDAEMFLFGLGFLLLETRAVTEMSLVWGATWITSAVAFGSILAMVLLATLLMQARPLRFETGLGGVVICLLIAYFTPTRALLVASLPMKLALSALFIGTPVFFAAASFAVLFREREAADHAFGWNLLGATLGGLLEITSMAVGLKALLLVALAAYLVALLVWLRRRPLASGAPAVVPGGPLANHQHFLPQL